MTQLIHPTPEHIALRIEQAINRKAKETGQLPPLWLSSAIDEGLREASREHDAVNR